MSSNIVRAAVIMAGGSGERFWPLSRVQKPKQLLKLASTTETLLQEAVSRLLPLLPAENIFVATSRSMCDVIRAGDARIPAANVIGEPCRRNTTGCLIWAAASLRARFPDADDVTMAVVTADHLIGEHERFRGTIDAAMRAATRHDSLVTLGVTPHRPDTGYGYVEIRPDEKPVESMGDHDLHIVHRFREKPNQQTAEEFLASGNYLWNSGMFFWRVGVFMDQLERVQPEMAAIARRISDALRAGDNATAEAEFETLESISIDYALLERAHRVLVLRARFPWDDVGSWDSLDRTRPRNGKGNVTTGDPVLVDVQNSIVINDAGADKLAVAVIGLEDVVVIAVDDAVLVVAKDRVQDVRKAVEELKRRKAKQL